MLDEVLDRAVVWGVDELVAVCDHHPLRAASVVPEAVLYYVVESFPEGDVWSLDNVDMSIRILLSIKLTEKRQLICRTIIVKNEAVNPLQPQELDPLHNIRNIILNHGAECE